MLNADPKFIEKLRQGEKPTLIGVLTGNWLTRTDSEQVKDDTEADWAANNGESNVDYTSTPPASGDVILADDYIIQPINDSFSGWTPWIYDGTYEYYQYWSRAFSINYTCFLKTIRLRLYRTAEEPTSGEVSVTIKQTIDGDDLVVPQTIDHSEITALYGSGENAGILVDFSSQNFVLQEDITYYLVITNTLSGPSACEVYLGGWESNPKIGFIKQCLPWCRDWINTSWTPRITLTMGGYQASGYLISRTHELTKQPLYPGTFNAGFINNEGSTTYRAYGSNTGAFAGEEESFDVIDGSTVNSLYRFWRMKAEFVRGTNLIISPSLQFMQLSFPDTQYQLCMSSNRFSAAYPIIKDVSILEKQLDPVSRITYGMDIEVSLQDKNAIISKLLEHNYAINMLISLELAYELTSTEYVSAPFYRGWIMNYSFEPSNYPDESSIITFSLRDVHSELLTIVPQRQISGEFEPGTDLVLEYDGTHMIDVALDLLTNQCMMSQTMIDSGSFMLAKDARPDFVVRRIDDTTKSGIYNTAEVRKFLFDLCLLTDTYICPQEDSRFYLITYNPGAAASADWAEGKNFRTQTCGGNLENGRITRCLVTYDWKGVDNPEDDVSSYNGAYLVIDEDAEEAWSSTSTAKSKLLEIITPWLGPEATYDGKTLAYQIAYKYVSRWAWGATLIQGVTPLTEYLVQVGDIIKLQTPYFLKKGVRGIKKGQSKSFFVISKRVDIKKFQIEWRLMEAV